MSLTLNNIDFIQHMSGAEIIEYFHGCDSPLESVIRLGRKNLTWLISKIICVPDGSYTPLFLMPFQSVMFEVMWRRKFPMILLSRGGGKCVRDAMVKTDSGYLYLEELLKHGIENEPQFKNISMFGENGYNDTDYGWDNGESETKKIVTRFGYEIEGTLNHPIRVWTEGGMEWRNLEDIKIGDRVPICRNQYEFGNSKLISEDMAYIIGALIGDGTMTQRSSLILTNKDKSIVKHFEKCVQRELKYTLCHDNVNKLTHRIHNVKFYDWLMSPEVGCKPVTAHDKAVPISIRKSPRNVVRAFLQGLFDTDGSVTSGEVEISSASIQLMKEVQLLLLAFGIISNRRYKPVKYKEGHKDAWVVNLNGKNVDLFYKHIGFKCRRKQEKIKSYVGVKRNANLDVIPHVEDAAISLGQELKSIIKFSGTYNYNRQLLSSWRIKKFQMTYENLAKILKLCEPVSFTSEYKYLSNIYDQNYYFDEVKFVEDGYGRCWDVHIPEDHSFVSNGIISHNSFNLALFALIKCLLVPGEEIVIVGKAFRQSKKVFEYAERLYNTSPILKEAVDSSFKMFNVKRNSPISHGSDRHEFHIGLSKIIALPLGADGESIRGQRASTLLVDEFASVNEEILEIVVTPFLSVNKNPQKSAELHTFLGRLKKLGANDTLLDKIMRNRGTGNQMIISGTASSQFNHFYTYWRHYQNIIASEGDPKVIKKALSDKMNIVVEEINPADIEDLCSTWKEYCIYKVPYTSIPRGFLDQAMVARNRITFSSARFAQEYLVEFPSETGGFITMEMIRNATPQPPSQIPVKVELFGDPGARYVIGIDPARQHDYFAISIVKLTGSGGYQFVYCRAFQRREYTLIVPFILELCRRFKVELIMMDAGGGGNIVRDLLCDPNTVKNRNEIIWDRDDERSKYKSYGRKILQMVNFTNTWVSDAIHGMRADIEQARLLFPVPSIVPSDEETMEQYCKFIGKGRSEAFPKTTSGNWTKEAQRLFDSINDELLGRVNESGDHIEDGVLDHISETIREICSIEQQGIPGSSAERFDLPKIDRGSSDVRHRDRYTAILLASHGARVLSTTGAHQIIHLGRGGTTPQSAKGGGRSPATRKGRVGGAMTFDYSEYYGRQNKNNKK